MNSALHTLNCSNEPRLLLYFGLDVWIITVLSSSSFNWICCHFTTCYHLRKVLFFYNHRTFCHHPICFCSKTWTFQGVPLSVIWNHDLFFMRTYDGKMCTGAAAWVGEMLLIERLRNTIFKRVHSYIRFLSKWKDFNNMFFFCCSGNMDWIAWMDFISQGLPLFRTNILWDGLLWNLWFWSLSSPSPFFVTNILVFLLGKRKNSMLF